MTAVRFATRKTLADWRPQHDTLVGVDSDGCVFPTMEIKQKQCFHPLIVSHWHLEKIEKAVRETAEFVNLYSRWRGTNRFAALLQVFDLLRTHPDTQAQSMTLPTLDTLRSWTASTRALGEPELEKAVQATGSQELAAVLSWSRAVNARIAATVRNVSPYVWARRSLAAMHKRSDVMCVSQTPAEALHREWEEHGLTAYVTALAGQEIGTKADHLALAARNKYAAGRVIMIGDAIGDQQAAAQVGVLFYPICPGEEERSWERWFQEAYERFLNGTYAGSYETAQIAAFEACLPDRPPWAR